MFASLVRETGWTWDYIRSLPMPRFWKILASFGRLATSSTVRAASEGEEYDSMPD